MCIITANCNVILCIQEYEKDNAELKSQIKVTSRKLKSLQDIQVQAKILQEENLDLQSQLKITQGELNKRLQEEEKKIAFQTEDVVCTNVHNYIHTYKNGQSCGHNWTGILVTYVGI